MPNRPWRRPHRIKCHFQANNQWATNNNNNTSQHKNSKHTYCKAPLPRQQRLHYHPNPRAGRRVINAHIRRRNSKFGKPNRYRRPRSAPQQPAQQQQQQANVPPRNAAPCANHVRSTRKPTRWPAYNRRCGRH